MHAPVALGSSHGHGNPGKVMKFSEFIESFGKAMTFYFVVCRSNDINYVSGWIMFCWANFCSVIQFPTELT